MKLGNFVIKFSYFFCNLGMGENRKVDLLDEYIYTMMLTIWGEYIEAIRCSCLLVNP